MKKNCVVCGTEFDGSYDKKFCGTDCKRVARSQRSFDKVCLHCKSEYTTNDSRSKYCCDKCSSDYHNHQALLKKQSQYKEGEYVICRECGLKVAMMTNHIIKHDMSLEEYKIKHNLTIEDCFSQKYLKESSDRIKGNKNPAYQHNGRFSPFSDNFLYYDEDKQEEVIKRAQQNRMKPESNSTSLEYWLLKGYNEEEAKQKLSERQTTFSLDICIEKYGEEEGKKRWQQRQDKWLQSLDDKPNEEKIDMFKRKINNKYGISNGEKEVYGFLTGKNIKVEQQFVLLGDKVWVYDFRVGNKLIEFNGDYYHCNPRKYASEFFVKKLNKSAKEIWEADENKKQAALEVGYEFHVIWEKDYNDNKEETLTKLMGFING